MTITVKNGRKYFINLSIYDHPSQDSGDIFYLNNVRYDSKLDIIEAFYKLMGKLP